ncbi:MAG: 2-phospho-L-lactate transferase [Candidatus Jordarchaeales archaeon]
MIALLTGGTGGLKLLKGFLKVLPQEDISVIVNTGDDIELHGLYISPDLDSAVYLVAGILDEEKFWGIKGDTFNCLEMMHRYGLPTWFALGDRDLATHIWRTHLLRCGLQLSEVVKIMCDKLDVRVRILPMTNDKVQTYINTNLGVLSLQEFWVKYKGQPEVFGVEYRGAEKARPPREVIDVLKGAEAVIIGPSNPVTSIAPILSIKEIRETIRRVRCRKIAVSPIVGGKAVSGPAAKLMRSLGVEVSPLGVAQFYKDVAEILVFDRVDSSLVDKVRSIGVIPYVTDTLMNDERDMQRLASEIMSLVRGK